jgi:hypothetical protein
MILRFLTKTCVSVRTPPCGRPLSLNIQLAKYQKAFRSVLSLRAAYTTVKIIAAAAAVKRLQQRQQRLQPHKSSNRIQRETDSNGTIQTFDPKFLSATKQIFQTF